MATQAQGIVATSSSKLENLPIFFGDDRDTITALHFADRVASNMVDGSAKWTDLAAFNFVKNALRGPARDWLDEKNEDGEFRGTWSDLKPKFLKRFMSKLTFFNAIDEQKALKYDHKEDPDTFVRKYSSHFTGAMDIMERDYEEVLKAAKRMSTVEADDDITNDILNNAYLKELIRLMIKQEYKMMARLKMATDIPKDALKRLDHIIISGNVPTTDQIVQVLRTNKKETQTINEVNVAPQDEVDALKPQNRSNGSWQNKPNGFRRYDNKNNRQQGSNNTNKTDKYCIFCHKSGHDQDDCFKRIREGKPCRSARGKTYYPKKEQEKMSGASSVFQ